MGRENRVYIAGPDVFYVDSESRLKETHRLLEAQGLEGVSPEEGGGVRGHGREEGVRLYECNVKRLRSCGWVLANLSAFRGGSEPDSGTCVEVGIALALGLGVVGYCEGWSGESWGDRVRAAHGMDESGVDREWGCVVEDFEGMGVNLMLGASVALYGRKEEAVKELGRRLRSGEMCEMMGSLTNCKGA